MLLVKHVALWQARCLCSFPARSAFRFHFIEHSPFQQLMCVSPSFKSYVSRALKTFQKSKKKLLYSGAVTNANLLQHSTPWFPFASFALLVN